MHLRPAISCDVTYQLGSQHGTDAQFLFKVWATGQRKIGECVIVFQFSGYRLSLSFLVSVLSFSSQKPCVTNPMSILDISPMTDNKTTHQLPTTNKEERRSHFLTRWHIPGVSVHARSKDELTGSRSSGACKHCPGISLFPQPLKHGLTLLQIPCQEFHSLVVIVPGLP